MKTSKKVLALLLCLALVLSLAACGGGNESSTGSSQASSSSAASSSSDAGDSEASTPDETAAGGEEGDWFAGRDFSEKMTINLATVQLDDAKNYNDCDEFVKWWSEKFNIEWDLTSLTFENWAERLRIWINSDDMPEMAVWNYVHGEAVNYADQGLVKMLPDDWKEKYPSLAKAQMDSGMAEFTEEQFGGTAYLFRPIYSNNRPADKVATHTSAYVRKDWAKAAGVEVSETMKVSELLDAAAKIKEANPGNVDNFYPIRVRTGGLMALMDFQYTYAGTSDNLPFYKGEDGQYHWGAADQETLEALKVMQKAYKDGLIDPEFYTIQSPDDYGMFMSSGTSAICIGEGMVGTMTDFDSHLQTDQQTNFMDAVQVVVPLGEDGNYHAKNRTNYWGANIFSPHIDDAKLDRILQMMDYSCTDYGQLQVRCGLEGTDWQYEGEEIVSLLGEEEVLNDKYAIHPVYGNLMVLSDDFQFLNPSFKAELREIGKNVHVLHEKVSSEESFPSEIDWTVQLHDSQALNLASMTYADEYAAILVKDGDLEANWQAWVNEKMPLIQPVLDELNAKA
ncbi:ABC transporter substrate-binding protein [Acutalibacter caecimuris]|uniref:ABC transporter substrate-binding protein n=1 Tax=Acutalibacter caecimuris TaxID=3093657 RepID=UPI002AC8BD84|nr:ABC transporter substrate-binding protein [Acutalibacter sp. M00118]